MNTRSVGRVEQPHKISKDVVSTFALPLGFAIAFALVLVALVLLLMRVGVQIENSNLVLAKTAKLEKLVVDQETGLRGFLLTGNEAFLEPYDKATRDIPLLIKDLQENHASEDPKSQKLLSEIENLQLEWQEFAHRALDLHETNGDYQSLMRSARGKRKVDAMRVRFDELQTIQDRQRTLARANADVTSLRTLILIGILAVASGIVLSTTTRRRLEKVSQSL